MMRERGGEEGMKRGREEDSLGVTLTGPDIAIFRFFLPGCVAGLRGSSLPFPPILTTKPGDPRQRFLKVREPLAKPV